MSVNIITPPTQNPTLLQRIFGTEPRTVVRETSTTTIVNEPGGSFDFKTALRNGGIGAAVAGALGGVSLLGKVALPIIGKVGSLAGLVKLAGVGGALGVATAAIPLIAPHVRDSPTAKAALTGAAIGGVAGAVLPFVPVWFGAGVGAGVGLLVNHMRNNPVDDYQSIPGYASYPGYVAVGPVGNHGYGMPGPVPGYGQLPGYGTPGMYPQGMPHGAYPLGMPPGMYPGYPGMVLPMAPNSNPSAQQALAPVTTTTTAQAPTAAPNRAVPAAPMYPSLTAVPALPTSQGASTAAPVAVASSQPIVTAAKFPGAKTFTDGAGNVRQVGTGAIVKPAGAAPAGSPTVMTALPLAAGIGSVNPSTAPPLSTMPVA